MKKILIISNYWHFNFEREGSRYNTIIELLSSNPSFDVELVTSTFRHSVKKQRNNTQKIYKNYKYKVKLLYEPGYKKNVSLGRVYSHNVFAKNLKNYLESKQDIDLIYSFVPSLSANKVITDYCRKNGVKHVIDVLDLWPEAFKMAVSIPIANDILFYPMKRKADYIYSNANVIIAVSDTYLKRAQASNKNRALGKCLYIGTDLAFFDKCKQDRIVKRNDSDIWIAYIGTMGNSYDIKVVVDAIAVLNMRGYSNIKFVLMGDGPLRHDFESYATEKHVNCDFVGSIPYDKMVGLLCASDIAVNPIAKGACQSITNKICDYAASGLPVINAQPNEEYRRLIDEYHAGLNCNSGDAVDMSNKIEQLLENVKLRKQLGVGNRRMAEKLFDRSVTYPIIESIVMQELED